MVGACFKHICRPASSVYSGLPDRLGLEDLSVWLFSDVVKRYETFDRWAFPSKSVQLNRLRSIRPLRSMVGDFSQMWLNLAVSEG